MVSARIRSSYAFLGLETGKMEEKRALGNPSGEENEDKMDKNSMEFWGNYLLSAARGQQNLEDMAKWLQQGFRGFEGVTEMFRKAYGCVLSASLRRRFFFIGSGAAILA